MRKKCVLIIIFCFILLGCTGKQIPYGNIDLSHFFIEDGELPLGWRVENRGFGIDEDRSFDSARGLYYFEDEIFSQEIYRHQSIRGAEKDFEYITDEDYIPEDWRFISIHADQSMVVCHKYRSPSSASCFWVARYGNIVIDVMGWQDPGDSTLIQFEQLVKLIDDKAQRLLSDE